MNRGNPEFLPIIDEIYREKVLRARARTPDERFTDGLELFDESLAWMRDGVRMQHPGFSDEEIEAEVARRFARVRQIEDHGIYRPVPAA